MLSIKRFFITFASLCAAFVMVSSTATSVARDTIDLSIGPVAVNSQAVNIALALSVEHPTVGAAYRKPGYEHGTTYLGYFDPTGCYAYKDPSASAPISGEYFYRLGTVNADRFCNGSGYSGNALNYVTTSTIDLLRYALTGGNRVVDTVTDTVLERAYLTNYWDLHNNAYFPSKRIPADMVGKVTPVLGTAAGVDIYGGGCWNRVWFGTSNASANCDNPGNSGNLNPTVPNPASGTATVILALSSPAPTNTVSGPTLVYDITSPRRTLTGTPTAGPITWDDITVLGSGESLTLPPETSPSVAFLRNTYTAKVSAPNTTTVAPSSPVPVTPVGSRITNYTTRTFVNYVPGLPYRTMTNAFKTGSTRFVCAVNKNGSSGYRGVVSGNNTAGDLGATFSGCGVGVYADTPHRRQITSVLGGGNANVTVYEPQFNQTIYQVYDTVPVYKSFTIRRDFDEYELKNAYVVAGGTKPGVMFARVKVCDNSEKLTRTELCLQYPDLNFKPIGEIQKYAEGVRVSAFGYLNDDTDTRYGGVLRAPMKYTGPSFRDPDGIKRSNATNEWNANNGIFVNDPLSGSPTFATTGVINYLNKFGTTGDALGKYKSFDPVGELYYEALRYFQGLDPTPAATTGITMTAPISSHLDGYPVYVPTSAGTHKWSDPVQNACERRNYILTIGDVNTHRDRSLPGLDAVLANTSDPIRAAEPLKGDSSKLFDSKYWTDIVSGFETNTSKSYVDSNGTARTTLGNPNPYANNKDLAIKNGGCCNGAYYWAGAAYWANTQSIRLDSDGKGQSMKDVRVKTFTIDADEGGDGDIEDTNKRGIKPRSSSFYLAGKYGWFDDSNFDGNPFKESGSTGYTNTEWENKATPNTPDGYVIASQAQKMIDGVRKFFSSAAQLKGAVSVSSLSSQRYTANSPNGDLFAPRFSTSDWSGTIQKTTLVLNTETRQIEARATVTWDASAILTLASRSTTTLSDPYVIPSARKIFTYSREGLAAGGKIFTVAGKSSLDAAVQTALNTNPKTGTADFKIDERIGWLRGERSNEQNSTGGIFRARSQLMGDIVNSGPVYKGKASLTKQGEGYVAFANSVASREPTVYTGTNGGMFHGFRASDGKEQFAYIPRAVAENIHKLTNPEYIHLPFVDAVPVVDEVKTSAGWKTIVASGMGGGAQGVFALDVTNPSDFDASKVLFEFTDQDDADMGNVVTAPIFVQLKIPGSTSTYKWFLAVSSGYNNYQTDSFVTTRGGDQALFLLSLDKPVGDAWSLNGNYFKIITPTGLAAVANGMGNPGAVINTDGIAQALYTGDLQGNLWKFDFTSGINETLAKESNEVNGAAKPLFIASYLGVRQPITISPIPYYAPGQGYVITFGTGKFLEPSDTTTAGQQAMYGVWDSLETSTSLFTVPGSALFERTASLVGSTVVISTGTFAYNVASAKRGWFFNLPSTRERISVEGASSTGLLAINSIIPDGTCSGDGAGVPYVINPITGLPLDTINKVNSGFLSSPNVTEIDLNERLAQTTSGRTRKRIYRQVISTTTKVSEAGNVVTSSTGSSSSVSKLNIDYLEGIISWRELRNPKLQN